MCIHTEEEKSVIAPNPTVMDLLRRWLASEQDLYKRLTETRRAIGNKAQGNIAIAGIFVAAVFSWIKDLVQVKVSLSETGTVGLLCAGTLFTSSVLFSVFTLFVRTVPAPREGSLIKQILALPESELEERLRTLMYDLCEHWDNVNRELQELSLVQSRWLTVAQVLLAAGIVVVSVVSLISIYT